jgi:hypothetical protein
MTNGHGEEVEIGVSCVEMGALHNSAQASAKSSPF